MIIQWRRFHKTVILLAFISMFTKHFLLYLFFCLLSGDSFSGVGAWRVLFCLLGFGWVTFIKFCDFSYIYVYVRFSYYFCLFFFSFPSFPTSSTPQKREKRKKKDSEKKKDQWWEIKLSQQGNPQSKSPNIISLFDSNDSPDNKLTDRARCETRLNKLFLIEIITRYISLIDNWTKDRAVHDYRTGEMFANGDI